MLPPKFVQRTSPDTVERVPVEAGWLRWNNPDVNGKEGQEGKLLGGTVPTTPQRLKMGNLPPGILSLRKWARYLIGIGKPSLLTECTCIAEMPEGVL